MADINQIISQEAIKGIEKSKTEMQQLAEAVKNVIKSAEKLDVGLGKQKKSITSVTDGQKKLNKAQNEFVSLNKKLTKTEQQLATTSSESFKMFVKRRMEMQKSNQATKTAILASDSLKGSYNQLQAEMKQNITAYKAMSKEQRENTKEGRRLQQTIQQQNAKLKQMDASLGNFQRNVGNYRSAITGLGRSLITAFGVGGGAFMFVSLLRNSIRLRTNLYH